MKLRKPLLVAAAFAVLVAGCGSSKSNSSTTAKPANPASANAPEVSPSGDIPDNQAFVAYSPPGGGYSVSVPEGWSRSQSGSAVVFTDKLNSIRMEPGKGGAAPAGAKTSTVQRKAGPVARTVYQMKGQPDAVTGKAQTEAVERYTFLKNGKPVTLTLSAPKGADNVDPWKIVTDSFKWTQ
jgi:hypothetical protein